MSGRFHIMGPSLNSDQSHCEIVADHMLGANLGFTNRLCFGFLLEDQEWNQTGGNSEVQGKATAKLKLFAGQ